MDAGVCAGFAVTAGAGVGAAWVVAAGAVAPIGAKFDSETTSACSVGAASDVVTAWSKTEVFTANAKAPAASTPVTESIVAREVFIRQTLWMQV